MLNPKKYLALVGFAPNNRHLAPYDNPEYEIWTLNHAWNYEWMKRWDILFDLHSMDHLQRQVDKADEDKKHLEWLKQDHGERIILMQEVNEEVPNSKRLPIEILRKKYGNFYTSSFAYMMAYALYLGYKRIDVYGFDMEAESEYNYQKDSAEYFLGLAIGLGVDIGIPKGSSLLTGTVYAFYDNTIGFRQQIELRGHGLIRQQEQARGDYHTALGYSDKLNELLPNYPDLIELKEESDKQLQEKRDLCYQISGALAEAEDALDGFDKYFAVQGTIHFEDAINLVEAKGYGKQEDSQKTS